MWATTAGSSSRSSAAPAPRAAARPCATSGRPGPRPDGRSGAGSIGPTPAGMPRSLPRRSGRPRSPSARRQELAEACPGPPPSGRLAAGILGLLGEEEAMREPLRFEGVMPANLLPFTAELEIDEPAYRRHLRWLADTRGVTGLVVNGHAAEVSSLDRDERRRALGIALDEVAGRCPVVAGVYADGTREAVRLA